MDSNTAIQVVDLTKLYWMIGFLLITNLGTIGTALYTMAKILWWFAKLDSRVEENTKDINSAFKEIRIIRGKEKC